MYLELHDYRIYYVNIGLRHQYGISVAESQTFLLAKRPQRRRARRNGCFRRLKKQWKIRTSARTISTLLKISGSLKTTIENEAEPELITDIRNRDQGSVLLCFCFDLFVCSFLKVKGGGIFSLVTFPLYFFL